MKSTLYYYVRSMRLYYGFVTATTVLVGFGAARFELERYIKPDTDSAAFWLRGLLLFVLGFFAWGFNQIFSDWCDRKEDAINAPHRPMVTGTLNPRIAFTISTVGLALIAVVGFLLSPWTLLFLSIGGALNIAYSLFKRVPVLNCLLYGCAISCCALFGYVATVRHPPPFGFYLIVAFAVVPIHALMCHNSYYKDVPGDRAAGVRTLQTLCPPWISKTVSVAPNLIVAAWSCEVSGFAISSLLGAAIVGALVYLFMRAVSRGEYHRATCLNCQLCVTLLYGLVYLPYGWVVWLASILAIRIFFIWYDDEKE